MDRSHISDQHVPNHSSPLPHRMPTISAAQALESVTTPSVSAISTGVRSLDRVLVGDAARQSGNERHDLESWGGIGKGHVTEVYGTPGAGKSAMGLQLCVNTLIAGQGVVWVDAGSLVSGARLEQMLCAASGQTLHGENQAVQDQLENLTHYSTPSLAHLIALLCHSSDELVSANTGLIVVDSLSSLIASTYPKHTDSQTIKPTVLKNDPQQWASSRKWSVLQYLINALQKLAALGHVAIVLLNQTATKMQTGLRAQLVPVISSPAWEAGIATRLVLFRDWGWEGQQVHLAGVVKSRGAVFGADDGIGKVVPFVIDEAGLHDCSTPARGTSQTAQLVTGAMHPRKRKADEIEDSEDDEGSDEDYGWADEIVQEMPVATQYQGSEDILVPGPQDRVEEEEDEDEEEVGSEDELGRSGE